MLVPSQHFKVQEFVSKDIYERYGNTAIRFLNPQLFSIAKGIREFFDAPVTINNWHNRGQYNECGFVSPMHVGIDDESPLRLGMGFEFRVKGFGVGEVIDAIDDQYDSIFGPLGVTRFESASEDSALVTCENFDVDEVKRILNGKFTIEEFFPEIVYEEYGDDSVRFMNIEVFKMAIGIREYFNKPVTVNTWHYGGALQYRGLRPQDCEIGSPYSAHKRGMALDFNVSKVDDETVQKLIQEDYESYFKGIGVTAIEADTKGWTHVSCENFNMNDLKIISFWKKK